MLAKIRSGTVIGLDGVGIDVEVDVAGRGFPTFTIVGLPNKAVAEAKDRVRTAIINASYEMPDSRLTVNLAPADIPKIGSGYDLPIAVGILVALGVIQPESVNNCLFVGELSLEGKLRYVPGVLSIAFMARQQQIEKIFVSRENAKEAALVDDVTVYPAQSLAEVILHLNGTAPLPPQTTISLQELHGHEEAVFDFADIRGQQQAKRAMEIAAAGFHNIHLRGAPGAGKTMLSRAFPSLLPPLKKEEILEVSRVYSIVGLLKNTAYIAKRPFRAPHHTTSRIGLIGGGSTPTPGEISLAHRGVLFLDEFPEFPRIVLESLRQPMEDGIVTIARAAGTLTFPARFLLVAASNPCPCGYIGHPTKQCQCAPGMVARYKKRLSGPLLDRIDLHIDVPPVEHEQLVSTEKSESSSSIRERVYEVHARQQQRFAGLSIHRNSEMGTAEIRTFCHLTEDAQRLLTTAVSRLSLSARSYFKIIKVSRTIADLAGDDTIQSSYIAEALQYRVQEE